MMLPVFANGQVSFYKDDNFLLDEMNRSKIPMAIVDLNGDRLDDIIILDKGNRLKAYFQAQEAGLFFKKDYGLVSPSDQFAIGLGDLDNDGWKEMFIGGLYDGVKIYKSFSGTTDYLQWDRTKSDFYTQNISCVDFDNDGYLDLHINDDDGFPKLYRNINGGALQEVDPFNYDFSKEDASGNYGSIWTDFDDDGDLDLYISKCRLGVTDAKDKRRINQLWINNGPGDFMEAADSFALDIGEQTWVTDFSDLDNDGDKDVIMINHTGSNYIFEKREDGYHLVETGSEWNQLFEGLQLIVRDLDNDGLKDILIGGFESKLFWNKGDFKFEEDTLFLQNKEALSLALGDLNNDGFWDMYAGYGKGITQVNEYVRDEVLLNTGNSNNFLKLSLEGGASNRDGIGASCMLYGSWGVQVYEIRSGESYGVNNSLSVVFGLGPESKYDSLIVKWPNGSRHQYFDVDINEHILIKENTCVTKHLRIESPGGLILCGNEDVVTLKAPEAASYLWSNGAQSQVIEVKQAGLYQAAIKDEAGCDFVTYSVLVRNQSSIILPKIVNLSPQRLYCGDEVLALGTQHPEVAWNAGDASQTFYALAQDTIIAELAICDGLRSEAYHANIASFDGLEAKQDTIDQGQDAVFTMNGLDVFWYTDLMGGEPIGQGVSFEIEGLGVDTSIYASLSKSFLAKDTLELGLEVVEFGLPPNHINGGFIFSVEEFMTTLSSLKCFSDTAAVRKIQIKDVWGNVVHEKEAFIGPSDSIVDLDFHLLPSNYYLLTTDPDINLVNFGSKSPRLQRSVLASSLLGQKSSTGNIVFRESTGGDHILYSFYDLRFTDYDFECESPRFPFSMEIRTSTRVDNIEDQGISITPNPFKDKIYLERASHSELEYLLASASGEVLRWGKVKEELDFSSLPSGVYFLRLGGEVRKLVKL